jgi:hypothetical protein
MTGLTDASPSIETFGFSPRATLTCSANGHPLRDFNDKRTQARPSALLLSQVKYDIEAASCFPHLFDQRLLKTHLSAIAI